MSNQYMDEITDNIWASFSDIPYPGDENIAPGYPEGFRSFIGKTRDEISYKQVLSKQNDLGFFSSEAICYYLPVFMVSALRKFIGYDLSDNLIHILAPPSDYAYDFERRRFREINRILGHKQAQVIITFCEVSKSLEIEDGFTISKDIEEAIERCVTHWKTKL